MRDEIALQRDVTRAGKAKALLENELLKEAFSTLEAGYLKAWRETSARDVEAREAYFRAVNQLAKVQEHLQMVVQNGSVAQADLNRLHAEADRRKRFGII